MPRGIPNTKTDEHPLAALKAPVPSKMVGPADDMGAKEEARQLAEASKKGYTPKRSGKFYTVTIHPGPGDDMSDVFISHNYVPNLYKRNVPVQMAEEYLHVLRDAVVTTSVQNADGTTVQAVSIPQYSYTVDQ